MAANLDCPHIARVQSYYDDEIKEKSQGSCDSCNAKGPNVWLCLEEGCGYVGCGESLKDHSSEHSAAQDHPVAVYLKTRRAWCSLCDREVFPNSIISRDMDNLVQRTTRRVTEQVQERILTQEIIRNPRCSPMNRPSPVTEAMDEFLQDENNVRGLTGLRNLGNTCYLNAAVQALSNCPPFTHYFLECEHFILTNKKPYIAQIYQQLMLDVWGRKRPSYMTPSSLVRNFKQVCPIFKGYTQQDAQEFLRCFMDRLHEELKEEASMDRDSDEDDEEGSPRSDSAASPEATLRSGSADGDDQGSLSDGEVPRRGSRRRSERVQNRHRTISASNVEIKTDRSEDGNPEADQMMLEQESGQGDRHSSHVSHSQDSTRGRPKDGRCKKRKAVRFQSIISDVFDGKILSSVQCLTCNTESQCKETFQDLSLPIPGKEDMVRIQGMGTGSRAQISATSCSNNTDGSSWWGWFTSFFTGVTSWFYGPSITLDACLAAFFSADDLKGDNMYSCEKCGKLRNGVKFSQMQELPEVLCIHLKRFRHDSFSSYSSKISNYVEFPIENLDMSRFKSKECKDSCANYDLIGVICHHGTAGGGHYTAYAQNWLNSKWYEFDDTFVTEVEDIAVMHAEAYVLFYKKKSEEAEEFRQKISKLSEQQEQSLIQFYISLRWINKFNTFVDPGPITNSDFLCKHGDIPPHKAAVVDKLFVQVPQSVWEELHNRFGGGPVVNHLLRSPCSICEEEIMKLSLRRETELNTFVELHHAFTSNSSRGGDRFYICLAWFNRWEDFVKAKEQDPPGPIDNKPIAIMKDGHVLKRTGGGSAQISEETWKYLHGIYGGGPELIVYTSRPAIQETRETEGEDEEDEDVTNGAEEELEADEN